MTSTNGSIQFDISKNQNVSSVDKVPLLDVGRGNGPLKDEIMDAFSQIYDSGWFIGGPNCMNLEQSVAELSGTEHAVGCASGSDALLLALMACKVGPGDEVILPSFTFFATASAVTRLGATPVFIDIDPRTYNMDPELITGLITDRTKAIIPVHLFGQCCNMDPILDIASARNIDVIEDCAQAIGATYNGRPAGSMGRVGCFSFYPTKNLGGLGDGGMLTSTCAETADRLRLLANHGMRPRYYHQEVGINSRLDAMQAAALFVKMKHVDEYGRRRKENADRYEKMMIESGLTEHLVVPVSNRESRHVWNQFTVRVPDGQRDFVRQQLTDRNVGSEIYYPVPLHQQECFKHIQVAEGSLSETEKAAREVLALPIFPELMVEEQQYVIRSLCEILQSLPVEYRKAS